MIIVDYLVILGDWEYTSNYLAGFITITLFRYMELQFNQNWNSVELEFFEAQFHINYDHISCFIHLWI